MTISTTIAAFEGLPASALNLLRPIENDAVYQEVMEAIEALSDTVGEDAKHPLAGLYDTLIEHAAAYEARTFSLPVVLPHELIEFLMEQQNVRQIDLAEQLGIDQSNVSRLLSGKKKLTADLINQLSRIFHVRPETFLF